jgi:molybdopterin-containing oxidoreductase family membrane subunit
VFNITPYKKVSLPANLLSVVCIVMAGLFIMVDLGNPQRMYNLLLHPQFKSPLMWDVIVISIYLVTSASYLYFMTRPNPDQRLIARMSRFALPVAIAVHSVTAWIFGLQIARVAWRSALMAPLFVASALDSGLALLLIVLWGLDRSGKYKTDDKLFTSLAGLLAVCVAVDAFFIGCEVLTFIYPGEHVEMVAVSNMLTGSLAPFFWGEILFGLIVPFLILVYEKNRQNKKYVLLASALIVIGVFFKRVWLLFSSFINPLVPGKLGVTLGEFKESTESIVIPDIWAASGTYTPSLIEGMIFLGIIAFGILSFMLAFQYLQRVMERKDQNTIETSGRTFGG